MRKIFLLLSSMSSFIIWCEAQSVITNGSFETKSGTECPWQTGFDHGYPTAWTVPYHGFTPDYFYPCGTPGSGYYPGENARGCEYPLNGQSYTGILALEIYGTGEVNTAGSEYIQQSITLVGGQQYHVEFWISRSENSGFTASVKTLGMFFTRDQSVYSNNSGFGLHHLTPQIPNTFPAASFYSNNNGWTKISGNFTPTIGGTWYIVIGNFDNGINSNPSSTPNTNPSIGYRSAFYLIDGVSIIPSNQIPPSYQPVVNGNPIVCSNTTSTYSVTNQPFGTTISWSASPTNLFTTTSGTGSTFTTSNAIGVSGAGTITATFSGACTNYSPVAALSVWGGVPSANNSTLIYPSGERGVDPVTLTTIGTYQFLTDAVNSATSYTWVIPHGFSFYSGSTTSNPWITTSATAGNYTIYCRANNSCGTASTHSLGVTITAGGGGGHPAIVIYPNPSSQELYIESAPEEDSTSLAITTEEIPTMNSATISARLIDANNTTVKTGQSKNGKITWDTSTLLPGLYYLEVTKKKEIIRSTIQVKH